ncbi:hypothetical protein ACFWJ5_00480 [Streptomyces qaidamensis]|uniref:hypothetical protein n=1 Tax=Streptomyces qaidamensis TaxID=1783515 RepID=UPI00365059AB
MDGQWATIYAAGIAAIVTLAGAVIAYRAGSRQVRDQGDIAHSHWLRTQREQAYVEYLSACEMAADAIYKCSLRLDEVIISISNPQFSGNRAEEAASIGIDEAYELVDSSQSALNRIIMLGPDVLAEQAEKVKRALWSYAGDTQRIVVKLARENPSQREVDLANDKMNDVYVAREEFTKLARQVLTRRAFDD